ncbi:hypothetical protein JOF56_001277 [Kibdelosporangium banguiense]|uniref:Uncharacterized protein n=1 Tax=Kibdelosporangium banguiense TaxID=1365924 RepID=A0ABS4T8Y5_9PSEU|nr:hypothetical protein [Kibdelosporangium banguiense]
MRSPMIRPDKIYAVPAKSPDQAADMAALVRLTRGFHW